VFSISACGGETPGFNSFHQPRTTSRQATALDNLTTDVPIKTDIIIDEKETSKM